MPESPTFRLTSSSISAHTSRMTCGRFSATQRMSVSLPMARGPGRSACRRGFLHRVDRDTPPIAAEAFVLGDAVDEREQSVVAASADVAARVDERADLPDEDVARAHELAGEDLHAA